MNTVLNSRGSVPEGLGGSHPVGLCKFTVCRDDSIYEAWPDVAIARGERLVCVFNECTHHANREYTRIVSVLSDDRGRTWSSKIPVTEPMTKQKESDPHWNCPRITAMADGSLVVIVDLVGGANEGNSPESIQSNWLYRSFDRGETWTGPCRTPAIGIVPDRLVVLQHGKHRGRWILSSHRFITLEEGAQCWMQRLWYSDDQGKSWSAPVTIARSDQYKLCEGCILELSDGALVCFLRENSFTGMDAFKAISRDGGETWDGLYRLPTPGCHRPVAGLLKSGKVMITYRYLPGGKGGWGVWTQNLFALLTDEAGCLETDRNQTATRVLPIDYDRSQKADTGYSGWVQFPDGEIYIVNYILDDAPLAYIRGYSLYEDAFVVEAD
ncbi:MAG: sialidase family protein [Verrucomicrobiota bacterium JB024]|nr:sialidase family protein [Verrucomicrobiota bacterium JB024]